MLWLWHNGPTMVDLINALIKHLQSTMLPEILIRCCAIVAKLSASSQVAGQVAFSFGFVSWTDFTILPSFLSRRSTENMMADQCQRKSGRNWNKAF